MKAYEVFGQNDGAIDGRFQFSLPSVRCPACNNTSYVTGLAYPVSISVSKLENPQLFQHPKPVFAEEFAHLQAEVQKATTRQLTLLPGTEFGMFNGKLFGKPGDVAWSAWYPFISASTLERLRCEGVNLASASVRLTSRGQPVKKDYHAIELDTFPALSDLSLAEGCERCSTCGRRSLKLGKMFSLQLASVPDDVLLFRLQEHPARIICRQDFYDIVKKLELQGIAFREQSLLA